MNAFMRTSSILNATIHMSYFVNAFMDLKNDLSSEVLFKLSWIMDPHKQDYTITFCPLNLSICLIFTEEGVSKRFYFFAT